MRMRIAHQKMKEHDPEKHRDILKANALRYFLTIFAHIVIVCTSICRLVAEKESLGKRVKELEEQIASGQQERHTVLYPESCM